MPGFIVVFPIGANGSAKRQREGNDKVWFASFFDLESVTDCV